MARHRRSAPVKKYWLPTGSWFLPTSGMSMAADSAAATPTNSMWIPLVGTVNESGTQDQILANQDKVITIDRIVGRLYFAASKFNLNVITGPCTYRVGWSLAVLPLDPAGTADSIGVRAQWDMSQPDPRFRVLRTGACMVNLALLAGFWASSGTTTSLFGGMLTDAASNCMVVPPDFGRIDFNPRVSVGPSQQLGLACWNTNTNGSYTFGANAPQFYVSHDLRILAHRKLQRSRR